MAARGVNGAAAATLNARFIKCAGCRVNVPKEDMLALGRCSVCGREYEPEITDGGKSITVQTVAFGSSSTAAAAAAAPAATTAPMQPKRRRWAVLTSKKGRTYYHNSETGEDTWEVPPDLDAEAAEDAFVPFKNDAVKNAVLREQAKTEATRMGVPLEVIAQAQRREQEEELANDPIAQLGGRKTTPTPAVAARTEPKRAVESVKEAEEEEEEEEEDSGDDDQDEDKHRTCSVM